MIFYVYLGGGWGSVVPSWVRAAFRNGLAVSRPYNDLGFRCARVEVGP